MALDAAITAITSSNVPTTLSIPGYVLTPNGSRTFYVRSTGRQSFDPPALGNLLSTVNGAAALARANFGDTVIALSGHVESISGTDVWSSSVAGMHVVGVGTGTERPTMTFPSSGTTTTTFKMDDANVVYDNMVFFEPAGTGPQAVGFTVTGAGNTIQNCYIRPAGATQVLTIVISVGTGADDFHFINNLMVGGAGVVTDGIKVTAAVKRPVISGNYISIYGGATVGCIRFTGAAIDMLITKNTLLNQTASSRYCIVGVAAMTGMISYNTLGQLRLTSGDPTAAINTPGSAGATGPGLFLVENYAAQSALTGIIVGAPSV